MGNYGTNLEGFGGFEGGVNADKGAPLVSTSSDGETALLFGPAALREIQANVANGDFAIPPDDSTGTITDENPLPYWTIAETGVSGAVTAAVTDSTSTASGAALTFSVAAAAATGSSCTITRYVPIAGNANRSSAYHPEVYVLSATGDLTSKSRVRLTLTATSIDSAFTALTVTDTVNATANTLSFESLFTKWIVPDAKAAYLLISVKVDVPATAPSGAVTVVVGEVRVSRSEGAIAFPSLQTPSSQPWIFENVDGELDIYPQTDVDPSIKLISNSSSGVYEINLGVDNVDGVIRIGAPSVEITGGATIDGGLACDSVFINAGVGSIGTNGTFNGLNANLSGGQGLRHDAPATTSQSSSAAIWVLVSGTNYQLRRNTSSARYKTNIVDADEVVLEASRKVKARHYESTIEDEAGATRLGFIAEEIHDAGLTHAVEYDAEGRPDTIDSVALIAALWHRVSDLEDRLKALEEA
jgi:hypothetical protein